MNMLSGEGLESARISGVIGVGLVFHLVAGEHDLLRIDDDDMISGIDIGGESRFMLASQQGGDLRRQAAECLSLGIHQEPFPSDISWLF